MPILAFPRINAWLAVLKAKTLALAIAALSAADPVAEALVSAPDQARILAGPDGAHLICRNQALDGTLTVRGLTLNSTAAAGGTMAIRIVGFGRESGLHEVDAGSVAVSPEQARLDHAELSEEVTVSVHGIRQDFLVHRRPEGAGCLALDLGLDGADVSGSGDQLRLRFASGRTLAWHSLAVRDAVGAPVPASWSAVTDDRVAIRVDDRAATYPLRIDPTFTDADWYSFGGFSGGDRSLVLAAAAYGGELVVAGDFNVLGSTAFAHIARWNGNTWAALGSGIDGPVRALAVMGGNLYAAGSYSQAGGVTMQSLARWNGTTWTAVSDVIVGTLDCLAVAGSTLYAGGSFTIASVGASNLAAWNGSGWSAQAGGLNGRVRALTVAGGTLYAGGDFTTAGGVSANRVAAWNGSAWAALGGGMDDTILALISDGTRLYASGYFTHAGGTAVNHIAAWNGSAWMALAGTPANYEMNCLALDGGRLLAGGATTAGNGAVFSWDGSAWSTLGPVGWTNQSVYCLTSYGGRIHAGGIQIACFDAGTWTSLLPPGTDAAVNDMATAGGVTYAGGNFTEIAGVPARYIASWDGTRWMAMPGLSDRVLQVAANGAVVYAGTGDNNIWRWNGAVWSKIGQAPGGLSCLLVANGELYAGGNFTSIGGISAARVARWNGSTWIALGAGVNGWVEKLCYADGYLYAGGSFTSAGGAPANLIARWDGTAWSALGAGLTGHRVSSLAAAGGTLYATGSIDGRVQAWNGLTWTALDSGSGDSLALLATVGNTLFLGNTSSGIASWDGSAWSPVGSGVRGQIHAMTPARASTLLIGGYVHRAGGKQVGHLALLDTNGNTATPGTPLDSDPDANQVRSGAVVCTRVGLTVATSDADATPSLHTLSNSAGGRFAIDRTGVVTTAAVISAPGQYTITVQSSDGVHTGGSASFTILVDTPPTVPVDTNAAVNQVATNATLGSPVGVTAGSTDPDGANPVFSLSDNAGGRFAINASSGVVSVAAALVSPGIYPISVVASDEWGRTSSATFSILVDRAPSAPVDSNAAANAVAISAPVGSLVNFTAQSSDPDPGSVLLYSLSDDAGGRFAINASTGVVAVAGSLGALGVQSITVLVSDGLLSTSAVFTITVTNQPPTVPIDVDGATNAIDPGAAPGSLVHLTAWSSDPDPGAVLTYSLSDNAGGRFSINASSGVVIVAAALGAAATQHVTVQVSDGWGTTSAVFVISVQTGQHEESSGGGGGGGGGGGCGAGVAGLLGLAVFGLRRRRR